MFSFFLASFHPSLCWFSLGLFQLCFSRIISKLFFILTHTLCITKRICILQKIFLRLNTQYISWISLPKMHHVCQFLWWSPTTCNKLLLHRLYSLFHFVLPLIDQDLPNQHTSFGLMFLFPVLKFLMSKMVWWMCWLINFVSHNRKCERTKQAPCSTF